MAKSIIDDVLRGLVHVAIERRLVARVVFLFPVDDFEQTRPHHAVVLAGELHAFFELGAVGFDKCLAFNFERELGDVSA